MFVSVWTFLCRTPYSCLTYMTYLLIELALPLENLRTSESVMHPIPTGPFGVRSLTTNAERHKHGYVHGHLAVPCSLHARIGTPASRQRKLSIS